LKSARLATVTALFAATVTASARDIYVDNTSGDDRYRGQSLQVSSGQGPLRSLQKAVRIAKPGDRIIVNPTNVPFREEVVINGVDRENPTADYPVVIEGNGATLDGLVPIDPMLARPLGAGLFQFETALGPQHTSDVLFVDGKPAPRGAGRWANGMPMLQPGEFAPWNGWLCYQVAREDVIDRHAFAVSRLNVGLTIYRSNHWIVRNLTFRGYRLDGIRIHGPVEGLQFQFCRFLSNGRAGLAAYGLAEAGISDSEAIGNGKAGIVSRNFARFGLIRVRAAGSPLPVDTDPSTMVRVTAGDPQPPPEPVTGRAPRPALEPQQQPRRNTEEP
jgi:hypothetical protein